MKSNGSCVLWLIATLGWRDQCAAVASGLVTVILRAFSAPLPKRVTSPQRFREENAVVRFISLS